MTISSSNDPDQPDAGDPSVNPPTDEFISKTVLKREAESLQKIGKRISELSNEQRQELKLPEKLMHAINDYIRFPSREAKRRQLQYIGRVMRETDIDAIKARLDFLDGQSATAKFNFHQTEAWRERLIGDPTALAAYIDEHPAVDRQALRHAIKKVRSAKNAEQTKIASRALFRFLRATEDDQA